MVSEEEVRRLARSIWEAEGCRDGKHLEHYFRARRMLEQRAEIQEHVNTLHRRPASLPVGVPPSRQERLS